MVFRERRSSCRNDPAFLLAILYTIGFFGFLFSLIQVQLPPANEQMIGQLVPVLSMIQGGIIQYFYQKSQQQSAEKKDETITSLSKTVAATVPTPIPALNTDAPVDINTTGPVTVKKDAT